MKKLLFGISAIIFIGSISSCGMCGQYAQTAYGRPYGYQPGQVIIGPPAQHPYGSVTQHTPPEVATQQTKQVIQGAMW